MAEMGHRKGHVLGLCGRSGEAVEEVVGAAAGAGASGAGTGAARRGVHGYV